MARGYGVPNRMLTVSPGLISPETAPVMAADTAMSRLVALSLPMLVTVKAGVVPLPDGE